MDSHTSAPVKKGTIAEENVENIGSSKDEGAVKDESQGCCREVIVSETAINDDEEMEEGDAMLENMSPLNHQKGKAYHAHERVADMALSSMYKTASSFPYDNTVSNSGCAYTIEYSPPPNDKDPRLRNWQDKEPSLSEDKGPFNPGDEVPEKNKGTSIDVPGSSKWFLKKNEARPFRKGRDRESVVGHQPKRLAAKQKSFLEPPSPHPVKEGANRTYGEKVGTKDIYSNINYDGAGGDNDMFPDITLSSSSDGLEWSSGDEPLGSEEEDAAREGWWEEEEEAEERGGGAGQKEDDASTRSKPYVPPRPTHKFLTDDYGNMWEFVCMVRKGNGHVRRKYKRYNPSKPGKGSEKRKYQESFGQDLTARPPEIPPLGSDPEEFYSQSQPPEGRPLWMWRRDQDRFWESRGFNAAEREAIIAEGGAQARMRKCKGAGAENNPDDGAKNDSSGGLLPEPAASQKGEKDNGGD